MSESVRLSEEHKKLVDEVAGQLDISIKDTLEMILDWFFSQKGSGESGE